MKFKTLISSIALLLTSSVALSQQDVFYAPVISVAPIERTVTSYELSEPICTIVSVPVERRVPIYREVTEQGNPALGIILGAVIGNQLFQGGDGSRTAGGFLGAAVGNSLAGDRRHTIVEYQIETHYVDRQKCERHRQAVTRQVTDGYTVVYEFQGRHRTITTKRHPGAHIKITTSYRIEP